VTRRRPTWSAILAQPTITGKHRNFGLDGVFGRDNSLNAKNGFGGYVGAKHHWVVFRSGKMTALPIDEDWVSLGLAHVGYANPR
jgi:hypothetical protein